MLIVFNVLATNIPCVGNCLFEGTSDCPEVYWLRSIYVGNDLDRWYFTSIFTYMCMNYFKTTGGGNNNHRANYGWRNYVVKYNCCRAPAPDTGSCLETGENLKPELNWGFDWQRIIFRIIFTMVPNIVWSQGLVIFLHNVVFDFLICWSVQSGSNLLSS